MKSPVTGKEMILHKEKRTLVFRKESFEVIYHFYLDPESGETFVDDHLETLNITQVYNQYRERFHLPFPDEIMNIRQKYGISARRMSDILGFGPNTYGNYEKGEIPSKANGRLIQLAAEPEEFLTLTRLSGNQKPDLERKILETKAKEKTRSEDLFYQIADKTPGRYTGYRMLVPERVYQMIRFFAETLQPWKTKLNKLLFYADFLHYKNYGLSISGLKYAAIDLGPVPDNYEILLSTGKKTDFFNIVFQEVGNDYIGEKIIPSGESKEIVKIFTPEESFTLEAVAKRFGTVTATELVRMTHEEKAWQENIKTKSLIDYNYSFDLKNM